MRQCVFLHGGGQGGWVWDQTIAALMRQSNGAVQSLALDAPGCGTKRGVDTRGYTFAATSRELIADIQAAGMKDVILIGHSQAGMTIPHMVQLAPEGLIGKLVYVTCSAPLSGLNVIEFMGRQEQGASTEEVGFPGGGDITLAERNRIIFCNDMSEAKADAFLQGLGKDQWPSSSYTYDDWSYNHLRHIPSSYIMALKDRALPIEWQARFADRLHARKITKIDAGHQVMNTRPEALAEILLEETRM